MEDWVNYIPPGEGHQGSPDLVDDPETASNPLIFPSEEVLTRAHVFRGLSAEEETKYSKQFASLTTG